MNTRGAAALQNNVDFLRKNFFDTMLHLRLKPVYVMPLLTK
jgi:hypothetical protein